MSESRIGSVATTDNHILSLRFYRRVGVRCRRADTRLSDNELRYREVLHRRLLIFSGLGQPCQQCLACNGAKPVRTCEQRRQRRIGVFSCDDVVTTDDRQSLTRALAHSVEFVQHADCNLIVVANHGRRPGLHVKDRTNRVTSAFRRQWDIDATPRTGS